MAPKSKIDNVVYVRRFLDLIQCLTGSLFSRSRPAQRLVLTLDDTRQHAQGRTACWRDRGAQTALYLRNARFVKLEDDKHSL